MALAITIFRLVVAVVVEAVLVVLVLILQTRMLALVVMAPLQPFRARR